MSHHAVYIPKPSTNLFYSLYIQIFKITFSILIWNKFSKSSTSSFCVFVKRDSPKDS